jgi:hypothetical protein
VIAAPALAALALVTPVAWQGGGEVETQPAAADEAPAPTDPEPPTHTELGTLIEQAVAWLVEHQQPDGSWGTHHTARPIEVLASIPGSQEAFKVATTALVVSALRDCPLAGEQGFRAAERGLDFLIANASAYSPVCCLWPGPRCHRFWPRSPWCRPWPCCRSSSSRWAWTNCPRSR